MSPRPEPEALPAERYLLPYLLQRSTSRFHQLWRHQLGAGGPTLPQWQVLSVLSALDGSRLGALVQMTGVEQPVMSRVIDQMERDGLVERRPATDDQRGVEVWLTSHGRRRFFDLVPQAAELVDDTLAGFSDDEVHTLHALMSRLLDHLDREPTAKEHT